MESKIGWNVLRHLRKVWVRVVSFAVLALLTVAVSQVAAGLIPPGWAGTVSAEAAEEALKILASSMLAVTTFSLAIANSAFIAAAQTATPRATALLQEDTTSQNVLSTFLGAFLFGLVGMIALKAGYYTEAGTLVLFAITGLVVAAVVVALLRWISHLMVFGRMSDTLDRVESAARTALERRVETPYLGGRPLLTPVPDSTYPVACKVTGHIQHVDLGALQTVAEAQNVKIWLGALPGMFVHPARPMLFTDRALGDSAVLADLHEAFTIGAERDFDQDPRFGVVVISEIASRALSPAVNDPGTAIGALGRMVGILSCWRENPDAEIRFDRVFVPPIRAADLIGDAFRPIVRDGAGIVEVQVRLQKVLTALAEIAPNVFRDPAQAMAQDALDRARSALTEREFALLQDSGRGGRQATVRPDEKGG